MRHSALGSRHRRAFATALVLVAVGVMLIMAFAAADNSSQCIVASNTDTFQDSARMTAEAGIHDAITQLRNDPAWAAGFTDKPLPTERSSTYTVEVRNNTGGTSNLNADDGTAVPPGSVYLHATGKAGRGNRSVAVMLTISTGGNFTWATFSNSDYEVTSGAAYDSFDSAVGPYTNQGATNQAIIGSNKTIHVHGGARVRGTAYAPQLTVDGQPVVQVIQDQGSQVDVVARLPENLTLFPVDATPKTPNANATGIVYTGVNPYNAATRDLRVRKNQTVTLTEGTYYLNNLTVQSAGNLIIQGKVIVYVAQTGLVDIQAGANVNYRANASDAPTANGIPANFQIFSASTSPSAITIDGGSDVAAAIYAPLGGFTINNGGDFFGSVIANNITNTGGTKFHFDSALKNVSLGVQGGPPNVVISSWDRH